MNGSDVMNNKGFTLVELLAVIVILSLVMGIASYGVLSAIESSKNSSEKIFVEKIGGLIDEYLALKGSRLGLKNSDNPILWCKKGSCSSDNSDLDSTYELNSFSFNDIIDEDLIDEDQIVNSRNKKNCFGNGSNNSKNPIVRVFRDSDYVYYYYVDLRGNKTYCEVSNDNGVINTLPSNLRGKVGLS